MDEPGIQKVLFLAGIMSGIEDQGGIKRAAYGNLQEISRLYYSHL
jgi:hypothetical protein